MTPISRGDSLQMRLWQALNHHICQDAYDRMTTFQNATSLRQDLVLQVFKADGALFTTLLIKEFSTVSAAKCGQKKPSPDPFIETTRLLMLAGF